MKYQDWVPPELLTLLTDLKTQENDLKVLSFNSNSLNRHDGLIERLGRDEYEKLLVLKINILTRLITRPEMESVWNWVSKQKFKIKLASKDGFLDDFFNVINTWHIFAPVTQNERESDFNEISNLARSLSILLKKYRVENQAFNTYVSLLPQTYKVGIKGEIANDSKNPQAALFQALSILPPLPNLLMQMATLARSAKSDLPPHFPRKITAKTAFRTFLINNVIDKLSSLGSIPPPTIIAKFIGVALDDYSLNSDDVRRTIAIKKLRSKRD